MNHKIVKVVQAVERPRARTRGSHLPKSVFFGKSGKTSRSLVHLTSSLRRKSTKLEKRCLHRHMLPYNRQIKNKKWCVRAERRVEMIKYLST